MSLQLIQFVAAWVLRKVAGEGECGWEKVAFLADEQGG